MTRRRLVLVSIAIVWLIALAIVVKTSVDRLSVPSWGNPMGGSLSAEVTGTSHVGQQFTAPLPGLYRIEVALTQATASRSHRITFHLKADPKATEDLWAADLSSDDIQKGGAYSFEFPPMSNSRGETFYFYLESDDSAPGDAIAAHYSPNAVLEGASAYLNHQPIGGNLKFRTYYTLKTEEKIDLLLSRMAEGRPYLLGVKGFYVGLAAVYTLVLAVFLIQIAKAILKEVREGT